MWHLGTDEKYQNMLLTIVGPNRGGGSALRSLGKGGGVGFEVGPTQHPLLKF